MTAPTTAPMTGTVPTTALGPSSVRRSVSRPTTRRYLEQLAWAIERDGLPGHEARIDRIVKYAEDRPVSRVLLHVLADRNAPEVARVRAFGKLAMQLALARR
ncbi:MAG: hypothetical protein AAFY28_19645 [Actinomycetota bacterium]